MSVHASGARAPNGSARSVQRPPARAFWPLLALVVVACSAAAPRKTELAPLRPVRIAPVGDTTAAASVIVAGTLGARETLPLAFKIGGVLRRITVDAGAHVRAGQPLAELDPQEIDAGVVKARAALDKAERDVARLERLYADSVVTRTQYDDARTAATAARADLQAVAFNRGRAVILAPSDGVILQRQAEPGQLIDAGRPVFSFGSAARGQAFRVSLIDRDALRVHAGDPATVRFDALPGRTLPASVVEMAGVATSGTGTYEGVLAIRGAEELPDGLVGHAEIRVRGKGMARVVPIEAMVEADGERGTVFAYDAGTRTAHKRTVRIGAVFGRRVAIVEGLGDASHVITDGAVYLDDGDAVKVVP